MPGPFTLIDRPDRQRAYLSPSDSMPFLTLSPLEFEAQLAGGALACESLWGSGGQHNYRFPFLPASTQRIN